MVKPVGHQLVIEHVLAWSEIPGSGGRGGKRETITNATPSPSE